MSCAAARALVSCINFSHSGADPGMMGMCARFDCMDGISCADGTAIGVNFGVCLASCVFEDGIAVSGNALSSCAALRA